MLWRPKTPFEERMVSLSRLFPPPPSHPAHGLLSAEAQRNSEHDLSIRLWMRDVQEQFPSFMLTRLEGGTQFQISDTLRDYFRDYAYRFSVKGPYAFPMSFNVVEAFLEFSHRFFAFDIRDEREHLLRLDDYIDWYTSGTFPEEPAALSDILPEGIIYSYNMVAPTDCFHIETPESEVVMMGVALVRHSTELSMILVSGESPSYFSGDEVPKWEEAIATSGKEDLKPDPSYTVTDRFFKEAPAFCRTIALVRFDLASRQYTVRSVNIDCGPSYYVLTDDPMSLGNQMSRGKRAELREHMKQTLKRYDPLFAFGATLIYLPAFFISEQDRVTTTSFSTELHARRASTKVRKAIKLLGRKAIPFSREVFCLLGDLQDTDEGTKSITPPDFDFAKSGFWKPLPPSEVGQDESGSPIVGKTWVERTETWSSGSLEAFTVRRHPKAVEGPNPGSVYVMRSGSHGLDLYKIGRTQRIPGVRAGELSQSTGVPTSFEVLAHWQVGDIIKVEQEAHRQLRHYKVNKRREFFKAPLPLIIGTITNIVKESA